MYGLAQQIQKLLLKKLVEELTGHLQHQGIVLELQRDNGAKPSFISLCGYIIAYYLKAIIP